MATIQALTRTYLRSPLMVGALVAILTAGQGIATVALRSERWTGHWPNSSVAVSWTVLLGAPIAAAAAAWLVAAPRRGRFQDLLTGSSRPLIRVYVRGLLAVSLGNAAGYLAVTGYVSAMTAPLATRGRLDILELLPTLAAVPAAVGVGALVGRLAPPALAPIVAVLVPYVTYALTAYGDVYIGRSVLGDLLAIDMISRDYLAAPAELLVVKAIFAMAVGAATLGFAARAARATYALSLSVGLSAAGLLLIAGVRVEVPEAYQAVCLEGAPTVCVDQARDHLLPRYRAQVAFEQDKLSGFDISDRVVVPSEELLQFSDEIVGAKTAVDGGEQLVLPISSRNTGSAHEIDPSRFTAQFGFALFLHPCSGQHEAGESVAVSLYHWWLTTNGLATDGSNFPGDLPVGLIVDGDAMLTTLAEGFQDLTSQARHDWFREYSDEVSTCSVEPLDVAGRG